MKLSESCIYARKVCVKLNVLKELNSSRMAASSPWRESYWRNVSYVEGLLLYKSTSIQLFLVLIIVCFIKRAVFTSKALMLELMAESLHPEIAQLIRCKNYSSKDLPPVAAPNHIGLESKICESLNYFRYTSIRSFSNVLLEPESRAKLVGGQDGGLSEAHIFSSHHMFCIIFGQGL